MNSIHKRLSLWLTSAILMLAMVEGLLIYRYVHASIMGQFDAGLSVRIRALASLLRIDHEGVLALDFSHESMPEFLQGEKPEYFHAFLSDGSTFQRSASMRDSQLIDPSRVETGKGAWDLILPDGRPGRAIAMLGSPHSEAEDLDERPTVAERELNRVAAANAPAVLFVVAKDRSDVDRLSAVLFWAVIVSTAGLAGACLLFVRLIVMRELRPLDRLASEAASIGAETLGHRFAVKGVADELRPIYQRLNDLLERLDGAFKRERRITADMAHELRTPIAELRSLTEVAQLPPINVAQMLDYMNDAHDVAIRMESLIEALLALARSQAPRGEIPVEVLELAPLIRDRFQRVQAGIEQRDLHINVCIEDGYVIRTERLMFTRIIDNLISNAVQYTPAGGFIDCRIDPAIEGGVKVRISNTNSSLKIQDMNDIFQPFWRKDASRTDARSSGLGLALVREYAKLLGLKIEASIPEPDLFEISIQIPVDGDVSMTVFGAAKAAIILPS